MLITIQVKDMVKTRVGEHSLNTSWVDCQAQVFIWLTAAFKGTLVYAEFRVYMLCYDALVQCGTSEYTK